MDGRLSPLDSKVGVRGACLSSGLAPCRAGGEMSGMGPHIQRGLSSNAAPWVRCGATSAPADIAPRHCGLSQAPR
eukprot:5148818-Pyramimonas_sp.AAC.1